VAQRVEAILNRAEVARSFWGIEAVDLETGAVVYAHNAHQLFTPASNAKMFTTAAGLALVGASIASAPRWKPPRLLTSTAALRATWCWWAAAILT